VPKTDSNIVPLIFGILAFVIWGLVPLFFHGISEISPLLILSHRILWSAIILIVMAIYYQYTNKFDVRLAIMNPKKIRLSFIAGLLMNTSWLSFVYAMTNGQVMAASLAFYITPVFIFMAGYLFFKESLSKHQWITFCLMILAIVAYIVIDHQLPLLSLLIAGSFAMYISVKKLITDSVFVSVFMEHVVFLPIVIGVLLFQPLSVSVENLFVLMATAPLQLIPLVLLILSVNKIQLNQISIIQYIEPTLHLLLAAFVFSEFISTGQIAATSIILFAVFYLINTTQRLQHG
jgi:chloramphenicol-sensitive protein RarD